MSKLIAAAAALVVAVVVYSAAFTNTADMASLPLGTFNVYGISNGLGNPAGNQIYTIDPATAVVTNSVQVTLSGFTVSSAQSLVARPSDGTLFAVIQTSSPNTRRLVTINPVTGVATAIGVLTNNISCLAFRANGVLYAVSGDGGSPGETLYTVSTSNAALTLLFALGNGFDGEVIAFHQNGLLYHSSGNDIAVFESINVDTMAVTPIGAASTEAFAMGYSPDNGSMYLSDLDSNLYTVNIATGARTLIGNMSLGDNDNRGLAFVAAAGTPAISGSVSYSIVTKAVPGALMSGAGSTPVSTTTAADGSYALTGFGSGAYTVTPTKAAQVCGAVNGIFSSDASIVSRHVVGLLTLTGDALEAAKVAGQPTVSSADAGLIARRVVGICEMGNLAGTWRFTPTNRAYPSVTTPQTGQDYTAYMMGDVDGDWSPTGARPHTGPVFWP